MNRTYKILIIFLGIILLILSSLLLYSHSSKTPLFTKKHRILACISSFKRPIFVSGQVLRMLNQSYPVDISLSIKGVPAHFVNHVLKAEWQPWIDSGRIRLRIDPNRDQFSNLLDTVRDIDLSQYDYFCKIDDDDWYSPHYFEHVNEWLNKYNNISVSVTPRAYIIQPGNKEVNISLNDFSNLIGPTMCFSRKVIKEALVIEQNPDKSENYFTLKNFSKYRIRNEDNYLNGLSSVLGVTQSRKTPYNDIAYGQQYPSVMRGNYLPTNPQEQTHKDKNEDKKSQKSTAPSSSIQKQKIN